MSRPAAACLRRVSPLKRSSRSFRYSSRRAARRNSGASAGRPSISTCTTRRSGNLPIRVSRRSSLSRRTMTAFKRFLSAGTPRQKRWGSMISSSAEKLLEWPLCGVADRKSRCSNRGARSRIALVILESMAYFCPLDGAAWCASSRMRSVPLRNSPSQSRREPAYASSISKRCETRNREWVLHGFTPKPRSRLTRFMYSLSRISKTSPKRASSSSFHCRSIDGGQETTISRTFFRSSSSRAIRPASMVLPRPTSSAMKRFTRGSRSAFCKGSSW